MSPVAQGPVLLGRFEVESPEWHAARANGIGGSEIAAVLGLSKWESRFSLWHRKAGRIPAQLENFQMDAGKRLEPVICEKFADEHPDLTVTMAGTYCHPQRRWQIANPDRLITANGGGDKPTALLEAKLALYADEWGTPGTAEIPPYYLAQCRWYLDVFGLDTCWVEVFIGSSAEFRTYRVDADAADQQLMRDAADEFLRSIDADERPDIDAHSATYEAIRVLHPDIQPVDVDIDADLAREFCDAKRNLADAKTRATFATSRVAAAIGDGRRARFMGQTIATRQAKEGGAPYLVAGRSLPVFEEAS